VTVDALVLVAALAQPAAGRTVAPVRVDAAQVHYAFQKREVVFTGAPVTLTRDDARLTCKRLVAKTDAAGQVEVATCQGDVRLVRGERVLTCGRAVFEAARDRVTCEGDPVLRERGTEGRGTLLVYDLAADEVRFEGEPGKPVRIQVPGDELEQRRKQLDERRKEARK
jgi:lipopolysaccharide export system protein LptA